MVDYERTDESRLRLEKAFYFALGAYTEQEAKKLDVWRDQTQGELYNHIKHELQEIKRSGTQTKLIHNLVDMVGLSCIFLAHVLERGGHFDNKEKEESSLFNCFHCDELTSQLLCVKCSIDQFRAGV